MTAKLKIPTHLYQTFRLDIDTDEDTQTRTETLLGFLHGYNPKKGTNDKKHSTQNQWAYGRYGLKIHDHGNNDYEVVGSFREWDSLLRGWVDIHVDHRINNLIKPRVIANTPVPGFKVVGYNSRWSTSNKLWLIEDPRGGQFEITTECMSTLIEQTDIIDQYIQGDCVWAANKKLVLSDSI